MAKSKSFILLWLMVSLTVFCSRKAPEVQQGSNFSNPLVADSITYSFINDALSQEFKDYNFSCNKVLNKNLWPEYLSTDDSLKMVSLDSLFNKEDIAIIYEQQVRSGTFKLNPKMVRGRKVIPTDSILNFKNKRTISFVQIYMERYGKVDFCYISMPLFNKNKSIAIIEKGMSCGLTCGELENLIFKRINKKWILVTNLRHRNEI